MIGLKEDAKVFYNNKVILLQSGKGFFETIINHIKQARFYLHFQFYIFNDDKTGRLIIDELLKAAKRGVRIFILIDGYATENWNKELYQTCLSNGIKIRKFSIPYLSKLKVGLRMHQKVFVQDNDFAIVGGINIANKYSGYDGKIPWLDFAVQIEGDIVGEIRSTCEFIWKKKVRREMRQLNVPRTIDYTGESAIQLIQNNWIQRKIEISKSYKDLIRNTNAELILVASYFFPSNSIRRLIKKATERGVKIKVVFGEFSDVALFKPASKYLYEWLLKNNIEIYEWHASVLHGKVSISDKQIVNIGSYNINALSDYGSIELNVVIQDALFAAQTSESINKIIDDGCRQITKEKFHGKSNFILTAYRWICYQVIHILLKVLFISMQNRNNKY